MTSRCFKALVDSWNAGSCSCEDPLTDFESIPRFLGSVFWFRPHYVSWSLLRPFRSSFWVFIIEYDESQRKGFRDFVMKRIDLEKRSIWSKGLELEWLEGGLQHPVCCHYRCPFDDPLHFHHLFEGIRGYELSRVLLLVYGPWVLPSCLPVIFAWFSQATCTGRMAKHKQQSEHYFEF